MNRHNLPWTGVQCLVLIVALLCAAPALAQTGADPAVEEMNRLNEEGFVEFRAGRYAEAARRFNDAYQAFPDPNLRKNEAVAWFKAGMCPEAMPAANAFLIAPDTSEADRLEARSIVANCRVELARDAMDSANWSLAASLLDEAESLEPDQYARDQIAIARVEMAERKSAGGATPSTRGGASPLGWVMVATGAAIVGGTLAYWLLTIPDREASGDPTNPDHGRAMRRARTSRWLVPLGFIGGATVAGIGVYLVVSGGGDRSKPTATAGLTYRW